MQKRIFIVPISMILCMFIALFVYYRIVDRGVEKEAREYVIENLHQSSHGVKRSLDSVFDMLKTVSLAVNKIDIIDINTIMPFLVNMVHQNNFKRMGIVYPDGRVVTTDRRTSYLSDREYVRKAFAGVTNLSDALEERMDNEGGLINVYATPLWRHGAVVGVLFATCDMEFLGEMLFSSMFGGSGCTYLVRDTGQLVAVQRATTRTSYADIRTVLEHSAGPDAVSPLHALRTGSGRTVRVVMDGTPYMVAYEPVGMGDLYVLAVIPHDVLRAETVRRLVVAGALLGMLILLTLLSLLYVLRLHRQIMRDALRVREEEATTRARNCFLATISHEIRTPINALVSLMRRLKQTDLKFEQLEYVHKGQAAANVLAQIVSDILDFSQLNTGHVRLVPGAFCLDVLLTSVCALVEDSARNKGLVLHIHVDPDTPRNLVGDGPRVRQIVFNLLSNAVKYTARGVIDVHVSAAGGSGAATRIFMFTVQDSGIGLTQEQLRELFRPFGQSDNASLHTGGGVGLGLAICHHLVTLMGGEISVTSQLGHGSVFRFSVPFEVHEQPDDACISGEQSPLPSSKDGQLV